MEIKIDKPRPVQSERNGARENQRRLAAFLQQDISFSGTGLGDRKKESFYNEMHLMFSAGIDIRSALEIFIQEQKKGRDKALFQGIYDLVVSGNSFSEALKLSGKFSEYEYYSLRIGEETGMLTIVLGQLAMHFTKKLKQQRQIIGALSYPVLVLVTSLGAVGFMLQVVVPMFQDVFKRFGSELPWLTRMVIAASDIISDYYQVVFVFLVCIGLCVFVNRKKNWMRGFLSRFFLGVPFFGGIIKSANLARFSSAMYLMIASKNPLVNALSLVKKMVDFYPIEICLGQVEKDLISGQPLHKALGQYPIFPVKMISLIKMAEEVNKLDLIFLKLSEQFEEEVQYKSSLISQTLEPVLIIFIGAMVAIILVAMYLPLFELSTAIG